MATVVKIYLRPSARTPVREVHTVRAVAGEGLEGDHAGGGNRQVTLLERQAWSAACKEIGSELEPGGRRANLVVDGLSLRSAIGRRIRVGECVIDVVGETRPCRLMEDVAEGLMEALSPDSRGGVYGRVVEGGRIAVGAEVSLVEQSVPA